MMPSSPVLAYWQRRPDLATVAGLCCALIGLSVIGWPFGLTAVADLAHGYPPMPYGSAMGFLLVGVGAICVSAQRRTAARLAALALCVALALDIVAGTIGASLSLHHFLPRPEAGAWAAGTPRIPPNAVLNFIVTVLALWLLADPRSRPSTVALLGSAVAAVGFSSLLGCATRLDAAYVWRGLPGMAIHGAATFVLIGLVLVSPAWKQTLRPARHLPRWLPIPAGMATGTATIVLAHALLQEDRSALAHSTLITGAALAVSLALAIRFAQTASRALEQAERTAEALNAEVLERRTTEQRVRRKLESVFSPDGDLGVLDLADLIDPAALQRLMDDFYAVTSIPMSVVDVTGRMLVGVGWQEICTRFHRVHPDACRNCVESDTHLSAGLAQGECRLYKCKNNLWDMATPIFVANQHVGNVFTGQFFLTDESVNRELFRAQAREYHFDEAEYLAALDRVPRLSRETVDRGIAFLIKLADTLSQLGYSNVKLARLLAERDRLAVSLRQSEEKLRNAFAHAAVGFAITTLDGRFVEANPAYCRLVGYDLEELRGMEFLQLIHPEDAAEHRRLIGRMLAGDIDDFVVESRYSRRTRELVWVRKSVSLVRDAQGTPEWMIDLVEDITERRTAEEALRQSEHFYRQTLESIPGMVFTTRPDGYCDYQSQQWVDFTGVPMSDHLGDGWNRLLHPDDQPRAFAAWRAAVEERAPYDLEYRVRRNNGAYEWFKVRGAPIRDAEGQIARWFGVAANIDALKQAEQDLAAAKISAEKAKAAAESANRTKDHFLSVLSHELRTPLMPVLSGIALLRREPALSARALETLDVLHRNVNAEARLIDDLLDLTRIERGKIELDRHSVDVRSIVERAIEVCRPGLEAKRLQLAVTGDRDGYRLDADAARLQQVLCNLLNNAIKFTAEGGSVSVRCQSQDGWVGIDVQDNGMGIEREALGHIFDAFVQGERSITRRFGGLGLGLAISKALIELHGGTIEAQSEGPGKGSLFRIRLPLVPARTSERRSTAEGASPSRDGERLKALHILLVEDHGDSADMMIAVLERGGHRVVRASDVASALAAVGRDEFDLLVSDLGLPDGSGLELIRQLRSSGSTTPAIAVSGYGQASDIAQSRAAGFQVHLVKPIDPSRLFEAMEITRSSSEESGIEGT